MKIYGGESKRPIDIQSMVVKTNQGPLMKIYGGESERPIDIQSMVVKIDQNP